MQSWKNSQQNKTEIPPLNPVTPSGQLAFHLLIGGSGFFERRGSLVFTHTRGSMLSCSQTLALPLPHVKCTFLPYHIFPNRSICSRLQHALPTWPQHNTLKAGDWKYLRFLAFFYLRGGTRDILKSYCPQKQLSTNDRLALGEQNSSFLTPQFNNILACSRG